MSEKKPAIRALEWIMSEAWAITDAGLEQIISIASREGDIEALEAKLGKPLENTRDVTIRDGVAVIPITGPIFARANLFTRISGATSLQQLALDFTQANDNPDVRAIVMAIDSPGGTAHGPGDLAHLIRNRKGNKPVIAYGTGAGVASAAFWIAAAADERVGSATSYWGSVGSIVSATIPGKPKEGSERQIDFISSVSPKKRVDVETDEGKRQIQQLVDDMGTLFVSDVAALMDTPVEKVLSDFGQGGMMIASRAKEAGMISRVATLEQVITSLSASTRKGSYVSPRMAAKNNVPTASAKEKNMSEQGKPDASGDDITALQAQMEAMKKQNEELQAKMQEQLHAEAGKRIAAEVETFKAPLLARDNLQHNAQTVTALGNLMLAAKSAAAGLPSVKIGEKDQPLDAKALGEFFADQVKAMATIGAKFTPEGGTMTPPAPKATGDVSLADFNVASHDVAASRRIMAVVKERRKKDPKFTAAALERELRASAH